MIPSKNRNCCRGVAEVCQDLRYEEGSNCHNFDPWISARPQFQHSGHAVVGKGAYDCKQPDTAWPNQEISLNRRYFVVGIDEQTKTLYEYNGCVFNGHPECTRKDDRVPSSDLTTTDAFEEWEGRKEYLEKRIHSVEVKWSCEWTELTLRQIRSERQHDTDKIYP